MSVSQVQDAPGSPAEGLWSPRHRNLTIGLAYAGEFGGGNRQQAGTVDMRWRF